VKALLSLKTDYKSATGQDWKPGCTPPAAAPATPAAAPAASAAAGSDAAALNDKIVKAGNDVRKLKSEKAAKVSYWVVLC